MGLLELKKQGWLSTDGVEVDLPELTENQLQSIRNHEKIVVGEQPRFLIYLKKGSVPGKLLKSDLVIRRL